MRSSFSHSLSLSLRHTGRTSGSGKGNRGKGKTLTPDGREAHDAALAGSVAAHEVFYAIISSSYHRCMSLCIYPSLYLSIHLSIDTYIHTYIYYEPSTGCRPPQHAATCPANQRMLTRRLRRRRQAAVVHKLMGVEMFTRTSRRELSGDVLGGAAGLRGGLSSREAALLDRSPAAAAAAPSFDLPSRCLLAACLGSVCAHLCACVSATTTTSFDLAEVWQAPLVRAPSSPPPSLSDCPLPLPASLPRPSPFRFLRELSF